ncbi:MAG: hypothetical protein JWN41_1824 [Thermoleophilia bacterium]|nr:hypothetical protein [Thermoleophilia bacterium]
MVAKKERLPLPTITLITERMHYIDLSAITEEHIRGNWEVQSRVVNSDSQQNLFADVRIIELQLDHYRSVNGKVREGEWKVLREEEIIYNPQLKFFIDGEEVGNAIITRLRYEQENSGEVYKLTLYFNTGLELILCRPAI